MKLSYARFVPVVLLKWPIPSLRPADDTPVGAIKSFILFAKGKNWEWSSQCTASVSSGSKSNHRETVAAQQRTCLSLPPVSCTVGERKNNASEEPGRRFISGGPVSVARVNFVQAFKAVAHWTVCDVKSDGPCVTSQSKCWTCALFTVTWRRHPHHEAAGWVKDGTFRS